MKILKTRRSVKLEFKRQLRLAITAAIGFTVAFAWRNAIFDTLNLYVSQIVQLAPDHFTTEFYTALIITFLGVLFIFVTSRLLREKQPKKRQ